MDQCTIQINHSFKSAPRPGCPDRERPFLTPFNRKDISIQVFPSRVHFQLRRRKHIPNERTALTARSILVPEF